MKVYTNDTQAAITPDFASFIEFFNLRPKIA